MKRLAALLVVLLAAGLVARRVFGRSRSSEELVTVSGEPIRDDAFLTDVGESITPDQE